MFSKSEKEEIRNSLSQTLEGLNELKSLSRENRSLQRFADEAAETIQGADGVVIEELTAKLNAIKEILKTMEETDSLNSSLQRKINSLIERIDADDSDIDGELNALPEAMNSYMSAYKNALAKSGELMAILGSLNGEA